MVNIEMEQVKNKLDIAIGLFNAVQEAMTSGGQKLDDYALALIGACAYLEQIAAGMVK